MMKVKINLIQFNLFHLKRLSHFYLNVMKFLTIISQTSSTLRIITIANSAIIRSYSYISSITKNNI